MWNCELNLAKIKKTTRHYKRKCANLNAARVFYGICPTWLFYMLTLKNYGGWEIYFKFKLQSNKLIMQKIRGQFHKH